MTIGTIAALLATLMAGVILLTLGLWRLRQRAEGPGAEMVAEMADGLPQGVAGTELAATLAARLEGVMAEQARRQSDVLTVALAGLKADLQHLKSDVEWLAGERMIEQAIQMAQTGLDPDDIGRELGLTRDTAETIATFRKH